MSVRLALSIRLQKISEGPWGTERACGMLYGLGRLAESLGGKHVALRFLTQAHRSTRRTTLALRIEHRLRGLLSASYSRRPTSPWASSLEQWLGVRLMVLKPKISEHERGVLLVKFSEMLRMIISDMDLVALLKDYTLVVEPSWSGYCDPDLLYFTQFSTEVFVQAPEIEDFRFLERLNSNLVPVSLGSGDWVNPELIEPSDHGFAERRFDVVMNASWARWKRHYVLFESLRRIRRDVRVALIGFPWEGRTSQDILALAHHYGVADQLAIFEAVPFDEVLRVSADAKVAVLLSLKEGANRAIPEALFCGTPALVLQETVGGVAKNVTAESGQVVPEAAFPSALEEMLGIADQFSPRQWAVEHISCFKSTERLNGILEAHALARGERWTRDIVAKSNSPELSYVREKDAVALREHNRELAKYLRSAHHAP